MHFSLHSKVLTSLIALFIVSLTSMGLVLMSDANMRLKEFKLLQAKLQARTLAESSEESLLVKDYPILENLVTVAKSEEQYAFAAIVAPNGMVYSHSDIELVGHHIPTIHSYNAVTIRDITYQGRPTKEIIYPLGSNKIHLANAHLAYYLDMESSMSRDTMKWLVEILILTLLTLSVGSLFITKHFTRHMIALTRRVRQNQQGHRLDIEEPILKRTDEVGALAQAFKNMSDQLVDRLEELKHQIKERDTARAANETKSAFLANISHELRTPLNAIIGYSELLMEDAIEEGKNNTLADLQKITNSARHLNSLIDDMLDLSKIEAGKLDVAPCAIDVYIFLNDITASIQPLMEINGNSLYVEVDKESGMVLADPLRLKQVVINLLSNATKFTHGGVVRVIIDRTDTHVRFAISDTGIGMSKEQLDKVFEAFTQADIEISRKYGGTGLGLTISKHLCEMMGGTLTASSELGVGSVFTVTVPAAYHPVHADAGIEIAG